MLTQAVRGRTGDRTSFRAGSLGRHDHTTSVHVLKCVPLQSVAMFGKCETTDCGELPRIFAWSCQFTLQKLIVIFYILKSARQVLTET
jgi:hypothetical protein